MMAKHDDAGGGGGDLIKAHGLSLLVAGVFLAGEMAGTGVLALPHAMVGTGRNIHNFFLYNWLYLCPKPKPCHCLSVCLFIIPYSRPRKNLFPRLCHCPCLNL